MKKMFILLIVIVSLYSCREEQKISQTEMEKYQLNEGSLKSLSPFSINFEVSQIDIDKLNDENYSIIQHRKTGKFGNETVLEDYNLKIKNNEIVFETTLFNNEYKIVKNLDKNTFRFFKRNAEYSITNEFINNINIEDGYALKRMLSLYVELYDKDLKKMGYSETQSTTAKAACAKFESSIGLTASAAAYRAGYDAQMYIMDGHSDCSFIGVDTSCVTDSHICISTVTMRCTGGSC